MRSLVSVLITLGLAAPATAATPVLRVTPVSGGSQLQRVNPKTQKATSAPAKVKSAVRGFDFKGKRIAVITGTYSGGPDSGTLTILKAKTLAKLGVVKLPQRPHGVAWIDADRVLVVATNSPEQAPSVLVVDVATRKVVEQRQLSGTLNDATIVGEHEVVATRKGDDILLYVFDGQGAEAGQYTIPGVADLVVDLYAFDGKLYLAGSKIAIVDPLSGEFSLIEPAGYPQSTVPYWLGVDSTTAAFEAADDEGVATIPSPVFTIDTAAGTGAATGIEVPNPVGYGSGFATYAAGEPGLTGHDLEGHVTWTAMKQVSLNNSVTDLRIVAVRKFIYALAANGRVYVVNKATGKVLGSRKANIKAVDSYGPVMGPARGGLQPFYKYFPFG